MANKKTDIKEIEFPKDNISVKSLSKFLGVSRPTALRYIRIALSDGILRPMIDTTTNEKMYKKTR